MTLRLIGNINEGTDIGNLKKVGNISGKPSDIGGLKLVGNINNMPDFFKRQEEEERKKLLQKAHEERARALSDEQDERESFKGLLKETFKPSNLASAAGDLFSGAKDIVTSPLESADKAADFLTFGARDLLSDATQATHYQLFGKKNIENLNKEAAEKKKEFSDLIVGRDDLSNEEKLKLIRSLNESSKLIKAGDIYDFANKTKGQIAGESIGALADFLTFGTASLGLKTALSKGGVKELLKFLGSKAGRKHLAEQSISGAAQFGLGGLGEGLQEKEDGKELADRIISGAKTGAIAQPLFEVGGASIGNLFRKSIVNTQFNKLKKLAKEKLGKLTDEESLLAKDLLAKKTDEEAIIKEIQSERDYLSDVESEIKVKGKEPIIDDANLDVDDYIAQSKNKFRDVSAQDRDVRGKFTIKEKLTDPDRDIIKEDIFKFKDIMHKRVLNENEAFKDTAILDFAEFDDLVKKIDSNKVTDKELQIARESMLEMANKIPKANNLLKEAKLALDFETFSKHADAQDFLEAELRKIWNKREDLPISQTNIDEITKAIDQALGGKPKFRTFKEQFETSTKKQISDADEKEIKALNRKLFGDDDVRITGQILANKPALGKYERGMIDIVDGQAKPKDTFYHETVHKYLDSFSTADEYKKALVEAKSRFNIKGSWSKVEEELAERFIDYAKTKEDDLSSGFFKKTLDRVKNYLKNKDSVDKLYNDILKGEAKKKTRGLAESVEAKAIKEDVAKTLGELPEYEVRGVKAKVDEALNLIADDEAKTIRIAMGEEKPPVGFIPEDFYVALVKKASSEGDAELLKMLATQSNLIDEATLMGQRIRTLGEIDPYSPVNKIKEVNKAKSDRLGNIKKKVDKEVKDIKRKTKATVEDWSSFVNSIKC